MGRLLDQRCRSGPSLLLLVDYWLLQPELSLCHLYSSAARISLGQGDSDIMSIPPASLTCRVAPHEPTLLMCVGAAARAAKRPFRPLHLQALLQLPRVADEDGFVAIPIVESLLTELAEDLPGAAAWFVSNAGPSPRLLRFSEVGPASA